MNPTDVKRLLKRIFLLKKEIDRLEAALRNVSNHGKEVLRENPGDNDFEMWYRDGVKEMSNRANSALSFTKKLAQEINDGKL